MLEGACVSELVSEICVNYHTFPWRSTGLSKLHGETGSNVNLGV